MKLFRVTSDTKVQGVSKYVDWYEAISEENALAAAKNDAFLIYGLPKDTEFAVVECDPETSKPLVQYVSDIQRICCEENRKAMATLGDKVGEVMIEGDKVGFIVTYSDGKKQSRLFDAGGRLYTTNL